MRSYGPLPDGFLLPPTDNHAYRIERTLGIGGCGITYLARNLRRFQIPDTEETVEEGELLAIKECFAGEYMYRDGSGAVHIKPEAWSVGIGLREKFFDEAQYLYELWDVRRQSEYVRFVPYYHVSCPVAEDGDCSAPGIYYLVMPYLRGGTLKELVGHWQAYQVVFALYDILQTLNLLHQYRVYHLDIKPENIMVGDEDRPVLIDFGMSVEVQKSDSQGYTPNYVSPEQMAGCAITQESGPLMDVYSLGVSFYEILTGKLPPSAEARSNGQEMRCLLDDDELLERFSEIGAYFEQQFERKFGRPYRLKERGSSFAQGLLESVDIAMSMNPAERLNCAEWLEELFDGFDPYDLVVVPSTPTGQSDSVKRVDWIMVAIIVTVVLIVLILIY